MSDNSNQNEEFCNGAVNAYRTLFANTAEPLHTVELPKEAIAELDKKRADMVKGVIEGKHENFETMVTLLFKPMDTIRDSLMHGVVGLSGEAGEALDVVKKTWAYGKPLDAAHLIEELADARFYYQSLLNILGLTDEHMKAFVMHKLRLGENARYRNGYSDAAAIARADKVATGETESSGLVAEQKCVTIEWESSGYTFILQDLKGNCVEGGFLTRDMAAVWARTNGYRVLESQTPPKQPAPESRDVYVVMSATTGNYQLHDVVSGQPVGPEHLGMGAAQAWAKVNNRNLLKI